MQRRGGQAVAPYSSMWAGGPFSMMRRISEDMDRLFESFGFGRGLFPEARPGSLWDIGTLGEGMGIPSVWSPRIEVCEREGKLLIQADLPGMKREDVNVRVEQDQVIIQGERRQDETTTKGGYYRSERSYGSFYRSIPLPEGANPDSATASFRDGVLEIEIEAPGLQQQRGRTLEIREGGTRAGTSSGTTYGAGTTGSMPGSTSGGTQQSASGGMGSQQSASGSSRSGSSQQSASGTMRSQQSSGSGTMYSGSGEPSAGAAGTPESSGSRRS